MVSMKNSLKSINSTFTGLRKGKKKDRLQNPNVNSKNIFHCVLLILKLNFSTNRHNGLKYLKLVRYQTLFAILFENRVHSKAI